MERAIRNHYQPVGSLEMPEQRLADQLGQSLPARGPQTAFRLQNHVGELIEDLVDLPRAEGSRLVAVHRCCVFPTMSVA